MNWRNVGCDLNGLNSGNRKEEFDKVEMGMEITTEFGEWL